ncbi:ABC transporter ATP-binding protein [Agromyces marinus]|uniref:Uncharacterized protein n=1 Tax=Agromyces marinus TaxID=1389020 RepID=A0ABM8H208_9MICO|nr:ABC transporter ATP-binding protein [Agromyces marinus]UIP60079.1 hypothetical protein DSM26151_29940 [Agromyces marinus]BDZ54804.1 hypothetical protein GCM10025870_18770 [Agromyces marinus]
MTNTPDGGYRPKRRDLLRPIEYVGGAAIASVFTSIIVFFGTHDWTLTLITFGGVFIVVLMVLALFTMAVKPNPGEHGDGTGGDPARKPPGDAGH